MTSGTKEVSARINGVTSVVGIATFSIYDTVDEAQAELGEEKLLELLNAQVRTNEMNRVRGLKTGKPSKTALRNKALTLITAEEFMSVAGDPAGIERLIEAKVRKLEAEASAAAPSSDDEGAENN